MATSSIYAKDSEVIGAVVYMAPEFFKLNEPEYKKSADIWAFGCVVFELLHLKRLFAGTRYPIQLNNVCNDIRLVPSLIKSHRACSLKVIQNLYRYFIRR